MLQPSPTGRPIKFLVILAITAILLLTTLLFWKAFYKSSGAPPQPVTASPQDLVSQQTQEQSQTLDTLRSQTSQPSSPDDQRRVTGQSQQLDDLRTPPVSPGQSPVTKKTVTAPATHRKQ